MYLFLCCYIVLNLLIITALFKGLVHPKMYFCHHLFILMSFQTVQQNLPFPYNVQSSCTNCDISVPYVPLLRSSETVSRLGTD